jgi:thiol-disulfide isomerase/thioredoxin
MGRLPAVGLLLLAACDSPSSGGGATSRSEQVIASGAPTATATTAPTESAAVHPAPRAGKLCSADVKGRTLPKVTLAHVEAPGAPRIDGVLPPPKGQWTWLNFWAAWCGPCKEEMPRLMAWQDRFAKGGTPVRMVFVSLDDDDRQVQDFLSKQPEGGVRSALWLPEGPSRTSVLSGLKMQTTPQLPEQALVDPAGKVRCFAQGAVEDTDYAEIAGIISH